MSFSKYALLFLLFILSLQSRAQRVIRGHVAHQQTPLAFASVFLHDARDSTILQVETTDSKGAFAIILPGAAERYFIEASLLGYQQRYLPLQAVNKDTLMLEIAMEPAGKLLEDVTVRSHKPAIERKADRTVFNVEQSIAAVGSDAYELLKKAPGVQVSQDAVHIAGKSSVSVMINDRLVQVDGTELESMLRNIPAADISKIEVITAPPARYDAEGNSGIINIVTHKSRQNGLNGNITVSYEQRKKASQNLQSNFNYRQGKLNAFGTFNANRFRFISLQKTNTLYPEQQQLQVMDQDNRPFYTWGQAGADYQLGGHSVIGFLYTHGTMDTKRDQQIRTRVLQLPSANLDSLMYTDAFATDKGHRNVFNLNYELKIDSTGRKMVMSAEYFTRRGDKTRDFTTSNFYSDGASTGSSSDNRTSGTQLTDIATVRADLEWPTKLAVFSGGAKATFIHNNADNLFRYLSGSDYVTDPGKTNIFDYRENTQALYAGAQRELGKWRLQLGLRAEYTRTKGFSETLNQTNTNNYFKFFPSCYVQYKASEAHSWNLNYTRRINRPSFWNMNPFRVYSTATAYEEGNPFLQPSFSNNIELGYSYKSILAFTAFLQKVDHFATRVSHIDTANSTFYFSQANAGNELQCGFSVSVNFSPLPFWETTTQLFGSYSRFSSDYYSAQVAYGRPSFFAETNNTFTLNNQQTFMAELGFRYQSRSQSDFDIEYASSNLSAGIKVLLFHKRITLAAAMEDILRTDLDRMRNQYNGTYQDNYFDERCFRLSLGWKFGNRNIKEKRERNTNTDDTGRAG